MTHHAVLYAIYLFGFFHEGLPALIQTEETVMVTVGNEACLNCRLVQSKDVLQVTWQKLSPEGERNVATFNKYYGQRVNADFRDKVKFKDAGLQNCSIMFRNVTERDEGCYRCMFNTYPDGALKVSTCLKVYELHEPVLHVESNSAEEAVVSCSATGRPAPTVTLRVLQQDLHLSNYSSVSVTNTNSTVTVTSAAVLSGSRDDSTQLLELYRQKSDSETITMSHSAVLFLLFVLQKGQAALVQTQHTVMAAVGDEACLSCQLTLHKEVLQVTWWKLSPEGEKNVATSTKYFGLKVNPGFRDKVEFKDAGLQNSSIVIRNVTEQDESCYQCLFNSNPEGALIATTCLKVYGLHEPILHVESNSAEEAVVSCSATGRPAPTVTLRVLQQDLHLSNYSSVSVTNTNSTVTVTSAAVLSGSRDDSTQVGCAVRVLSGPQKEVFLMIPEVKQSSADAQRSDDGDHTFTWIIVLFAVVAFICVVVVITVLFLRKHWQSSSHKDSEAIKTPQKPADHAHEPKTPLMQQENELRQRATPSTRKRYDKRIDNKTSSPSIRCQLFPSN